VNALAQHNKMTDPAAMRAGRRLMIPTAEALGGRSTSSSTAVASSKPQTPPAKPAAPKTYTVKEGDSLAQIAQKFLGSKNKWKKLHDMNRDVIDDPDDIKVGTVLKVL
jgi:nucleoid-associated protein YgaU